MKIQKLIDGTCLAQGLVCRAVAAAARSSPVPLSPTPSVTEDDTCGCHECAGTCLGLGPGLEPQSPALVLGGQGVLWQVPLRAAMSSHLHSGFHFPCPQPMNWGEQLGPCVLERALCPCLSVPCTGVPWPRGEEATAGIARGVLNAEPGFRMCWSRGFHGSQHVLPCPLKVMAKRLPDCSEVPASSGMRSLVMGTDYKELCSQTGSLTHT